MVIFIEESFCERLPQLRGEPEIFWFSFIFFVTSSALDHFATAPRCDLDEESLLELPDCRPWNDVAETDGGEGDDGEVDAFEVRHVFDGAQDEGEKEQHQ